MASTRFKIGDKVRRTTATKKGTYGTSVKGEEYTVRSVCQGYIGIFLKKDNEPEGGAWLDKNFELVVEAPPEPIDWSIVEDISFGDLPERKQKLVVKGYSWQCKCCEAMAKGFQNALHCCGEDEVNYVEMPDYLWYSTSKDELVHIDSMITIHLKAAIKKLRKEKESNQMFHLLPALESEASRRNMDI